MARTIIQIVFIILSIIMTVIVLMQEGKNNGLGALTGSADTYWSKNKGRSMEGMLVKVTRVLLALFLIISAVLTIGRFQVRIPKRLSVIEQVPLFCLIRKRYGNVFRG
ncbi:MAG: preprotein translocase subunit SecG [Eubacterium sp.]